MASDNTHASASHRFLHLVRRLAIWPTLFTAILLLLVFYHPLILSETHRDGLFAPISTFAHPDNLELWNPNPGGGMPVWGNPDDVARINFIDAALFALLSPLKKVVPNSVFLYVILNMLLFCGGAYAFARKNGLSQLSSAFVALLLLLMPQYVAGVLGGAWRSVLALALMPLILLFMQYLFERRNIFWFVLSVFFYAWQLLRAGAVVTVITTVLVVAVYVVFLFSRRDSEPLSAKLKSGLLMPAVFVLSFTGAAYVYAPFFDYLHYAQVDVPSHTNSIADLLLFILPSFNGALVDSSPHFSHYVSIIVLFFAGFAVLLHRRIFVYIFTGLVFVFITVSVFGRAVEASYALPFLLVVLAGFGLDALLHRDQPKTAREKRSLDIYMIMTFSLVAALLALMLINKSAFMQHILNQAPLLTIPKQQLLYKAALVESTIIFGFVLTAFVIVRLFLKTKISGGFFALIILLLGLIDLLLVDYKIDIQPNQSKKLPEHVQLLLQQDDSTFRVFSTVDHAVAGYPAISECYGMPLKVMRDFYAESGFNEPDVIGMRNPFFSKYTRLVSRFGEIIEEPIPVQYIDPARLNFDRAMLDMLNVKYIFCNSPIYDPQYRTISDSGIYVYENTSVLPRVFFVDSVAVLPGRRAIFDEMKSPDFNSSRVLLVEKEPPFAIAADDSNSISMDAAGSRRLSVQVDVKKPAALVFSEIYYPAGWKAFVDGIPEELYQANHVVRALFVENGRHSIELKFQPASFLIGWWMSIATFGLLIFSLALNGVYALWQFGRKKRAL